MRSQTKIKIKVVQKMLMQIVSKAVSIHNKYKRKMREIEAF